MITRTSQLKTSSVKGGTWVLACDQHVASSINEDNFKEGKLAQDNIAHPSMKATKSAGTTNKATNAMAARKNRRYIAGLEPLSNDNENEEAKRHNRRTSSGKTAVSCKMHIRFFLSRADGYFYLSKFSDMNHDGHIELPNACIPQNESHLSEEDMSMMNHMFNANIPASHISRVIQDIKGKHKTLLKAKTISNMREGNELT